MLKVEGIVDVDTIGDIARHHSKTRPNRTAIHFERKRITFGELDQRANQVANGLISTALPPQARIAILSKNVPAFFELWFGAAKADMVLVPVNFRLAPAEVAYVVADAGAELLFVGADFYPVVDKVAQEMKSVRQIIALDEPHGSWTNYADWIASQPMTDPGLNIAADHCAIQMYTSGTTGYPKGAQLSHSGLLALSNVGLRSIGGWHENDVNLVCMPVFHIGGSGWALIGLHRGIDSLLLRDADPAAIHRAIPELRITKAFMVPALIIFTLQNPQCKTTDFSSLELIYYGASPAPIDLVRNAIKAFGCELAQVYGLTETTAPSRIYRPKITITRSALNPAASRWLESKYVWSMQAARMFPRARSARSSRARRKICWVIGTSRKRPAAPFAANGFIPATPAISIKTVTSTSTIGSRT